MHCILWFKISYVIILIVVDILLSYDEDFGWLPILGALKTTIESLLVILFSVMDELQWPIKFEIELISTRVSAYRVLTIFLWK